MLDIPKHRKEMLQILLAIYKQPWSKYIALKWGTMCYFLYNLDRFSTDLDFDILENNYKETIAADTIKIVSSFGEFKNETKWKSLHRLIYSYWASDHNIKIEFNTKKFRHNKYQRTSLLGENILCMTKESAFANKLFALSNRVANRDLYDVYWMEKNKRVFDIDIIQERTWKSMEIFFSDLENHIKANFHTNTILWQLWIVLSDKQKIEVKKNLIPNVLDMVKLWKYVYKDS